MDLEKLKIVEKAGGGWSLKCDEKKKNWQHPDQKLLPSRS